MEWYLQIKLGVLAWGILEVVDDNFLGVMETQLSIIVGVATISAISESESNSIS